MHTLIRHANAVASWAAGAVLAEEELEGRAEAFAHMLGVGVACARLRNYNGLFEVMAGLDSAAVHRLRATKASLSAEARHDLEEAARIAYSIS